MRPTGSVAVIDTVAMRVTATIAVKPGLEYAALAKDGTLFVNNEDANEIEVIDVARGTVLAPIVLPGCEGPTGLGYDARGNRLISACGNGKAAVVDAARRRVVTAIDIGKGADAVIVDEARHRAFVPCGASGVLEILALSPSGVTRTSTLATEVGARTGALDPRTGAIYLPTARFAAPVAPAKRPTPVPGSFHVVKVVAS